MCIYLHYLIFVLNWKTCFYFKFEILCIKNNLNPYHYISLNNAFLNTISRVFIKLRFYMTYFAKLINKIRSAGEYIKHKKIQQKKTKFFEFLILGNIFLILIHLFSYFLPELYYFSYAGQNVLIYLKMLEYLRLNHLNFCKIAKSSILCNIITKNNFKVFFLLSLHDCFYADGNEVLYSVKLKLRKSFVRIIN